MRTEFRKAVLPREIKSLMAFDQKIFSPSDAFDAAMWKAYEAYWMVIDGVKVGCCAFEHNVDFQEDISTAATNRSMKGSLYVSTTGILPEFQGRGFGRLLKSWQIAYARHHGFTRIVTNTRKRNIAMIRLNRQFGFRIIRTTAGYYTDPTDSTVLMELRIGRLKRNPPRKPAERLSSRAPR